MRAGRAAGRPKRISGIGLWIRRSSLCGGLLIGLPTFQAEFDPVCATLAVVTLRDPRRHRR